jgi:mitochondrial inner membrane protease subunit 1
MLALRPAGRSAVSLLRRSGNSVRCSSGGRASSATKGVRPGQRRGRVDRRDAGQVDGATGDALFSGSEGGSAGSGVRGSGGGGGGGGGSGSGGSSSARETMATLSTLARFGAGAYAFQVYVMNSTLCVGPSMLPTLNARGDVLLTEYMSPRLSRLKSGDVVVATKPNDSSVTVIKRIRGMEGERIWVRQRSWPSPRLIQVPRGHVWLEGDNPLQSTDSREYGPVPLGLVRGRIVARFWPLTQACFMVSHVIDHTEVDREGAAAGATK